MSVSHAVCEPLRLPTGKAGVVESVAGSVTGEVHLYDVALAIDGAGKDLKHGDCS